MALLLEPLHEFDHKYRKVRDFAALVNQDIMLCLKFTQLFLIGDWHTLLLMLQ